jgi:hypothetical protein
MNSNDQYASLYDYRGQASRETGLGQKVYAAAKEKSIHVIYQDLPAERQREDYNRVATYPISFLDEYFGKTTTTTTTTTPPQSDLIYLLGRLEALEKQFAEVIKKLETNVTNSYDDVDDLPF